MDNLFSMSDSQTHYHFKLDFQNGDQYIGGEWLTNWGLVTPYGDIDVSQLGSGNGLLPDGTKQLPETMSVKSSEIHWIVI